MEKRKLFLLPLFCLLLSGCTNNKPKPSNSSSENPSSEITPSSSENNPSEEPSEEPSETSSEDPSETSSEDPSETSSEDPSETSSEEPSESSSEDPSSEDPTSISIENNAYLSDASMALEIGDSFVLEVIDAPEGFVPEWSVEGDSVSCEPVDNVTRLSATITAVKSGISTVNVLVGEKELSCMVNVAMPPQPLATPEFSVNENGNGLIYGPVTGAAKYLVQVNDGEPEETTSTEYLFSEEIGEYTIKVTAVAGPGYLDSEATYTYTVDTTEVGDLSCSDGKITWTSLKGVCAQYKAKDGEYSDVDGNYATITLAGEQYIRAKAGYDENNHVYYIDGEENEKTILGSPIGEQYDIEKGNYRNTNELREKYTITYYGSGWEPSSFSKVFLDNIENEGYTSGNAVKARYCINGNSFKYTKDVVLSGSYDTMKITAKGDGHATVRIQLQVTKATQLYGVTLTGIYATYNLGVLDDQWKTYTIKMMDDNWSINVGSQGYKPSEVPAKLATYNVTAGSYLDLIPCFDVCSFLLQYNGGSGNESFVYLDDFMLMNSEEEAGEEVIERQVALKSEYAYRNDDIHGRMAVAEDGETAEVILSNGDKLDVNLAIDQENKKLTVTSEVEDKDFVLTLVTDNYGATWTYESCEGTLAAQFEDVEFARMKLLDDFTSYEETGEGYDGNTWDLDGRSGLRRNYYCDYYSGGSDNPSAVGGPNWELPTSTDYLDLDKENGYMDDQCGSFKSSSGSNMRYINFDFALPILGESASAPALGNGFKKFSLMAKGSDKRDVKFRIYVYYQDSISPSTQQSNRTIKEGIIIEKDSDWTEVTVDLDTTKVYYGFAIVTDYNSSSSAHLLIDDICMYDDINPYGS